MRLENLKCLKRSNYAYTVVKSFINNCDEIIFWKFAAWLISSTQRYHTSLKDFAWL